MERVRRYPHSVGLPYEKPVSVDTDSGVQSVHPTHCLPQIEHEKQGACNEGRSSESVQEARPEHSRSADARGEEFELQRVECQLSKSLIQRLLGLVFPDQRRHERLVVPPLVGYLGTVRDSSPYRVTDISLSGFCMLTEERWTPGTEMPVTLQTANLPGEDDAECFTVQATVVRCGSDGVGFKIVLSEENSEAVHGNPLRVKWVTKPELDEFLERLKESTQSQEAMAGQAVTLPRAENAAQRLGII